MWCEKDKRMLEIPRWFVGDSLLESSCSPHVFTDASKPPYPVVVFIRVENWKGVSVQFVMSRLRVAPTKKVTIPRMELLGCYIGARLATTEKEMIDMPRIK